MTKNFDKQKLRKIRKRRSGIIIGSSERPRVVFSESNRYLRVQAIDDTAGHTLLYSSTRNFTEEEIGKLKQQMESERNQPKVNSKNYSRKNKIYASRLGEVFAEKLKKA